MKSDTQVSGGVEVGGYGWGEWLPETAFRAV